MSKGINIGDRVRIAAAPEAPVLTAQALFLHGDPEEPWASCQWHKGAQLVDFRLSALVREGGA